MDKTLYVEVLRSEWDNAQSMIEQQAREIERFKAARSEKGSRKALGEMNAKLRSKVGSLERDVAFLRQHKNDYMDAAEETRKALTAELAALRSQQPGVVLPEREKAIDAWGHDMGGNYDEGHAYGLNECLDEVARLNSSPVSAGDADDQAYDAEAERLTAEALGTGAGINPDATSVDDIFLDASAGGVDERAAPVKMEQDLDAVALCGCRIVHSNKNGNILVQCQQHSRAALTASAQSVPDGYVLVPKRMELMPADIASIMFHCGGDQDATEVDEMFVGGVLWVGDIKDDDDKLVHGLHIATTDYPEEGSTTLVEFAAAPAPGKGGDRV